MTRMAAILGGSFAIFLAFVPPGAARAECRDGACRDPRAPTALPAQAALSPGAREVVLYLDAWAGYRAMALRYGREHPEMVGRRAALATLALELDAARARGASIARAEVVEWLRAAILEVESRLTELGARCGPQHLDLRGAEARRDALREALAHWSAGDTFLPDRDGPA